MSHDYDCDATVLGARCAGFMGCLPPYRRSRHSMVEGADCGIAEDRLLMTRRLLDADPSDLVGGSGMTFFYCPAEWP
jgi:hypothetical protein